MLAEGPQRIAVAPVVHARLALMDRLDLLLTYGTMSDETRRTIRDAVAPFPPQFRARFAIYLVLLSPEYVVSN